MKIKHWCVIASAVSLSACGGGSGNGVTTFFSTPDANGNIETSFENNVQNGRLIDINGNGFAYEFGSIPEEGFFATAGVVPTTEFGSRPDSGVVTYDGVYELYHVTGISEDDGMITGSGRRAFGPISLVGNFNQNTLTGTSGDLQIDGTIDGTTLSGTAIFNGVSGSLQGGVDSDKTIGAFHGKSSTELFAGGFGAN